MIHNTLKHLIRFVAILSIAIASNSSGNSGASCPYDYASPNNHTATFNDLVHIVGA